mmetsp:Transcript_43779/g.102173  ORF Transcript_43779/g.102173 Transcript_43779/m.102173 type:complete len:396 (+) Transcript_43779:40-1227(+)
MAEYHGVWSQIAPESLPVDENLVTWTMEERAQYLQTNGLLVDGQESFLGAFLCDILATSVLPAPWSFCRDEQGSAFFWNQTTNETAWVHPLDTTLREVLSAVQTCVQLPANLRDQTLNALQESWEAGMTKLLFEWAQAEDEAGQAYYHNPTTETSMWEHPSLVFLPRQYMREQALNRMRDIAYLEGIGAIQRRGGSPEVYQALKMSKMKIAEQISVLSPKSKSNEMTLERAPTADTMLSSADSKDQASKPVPQEKTSPEQAEPDKFATAPARMVQRGIELERNSAAAKSVLRLAGDLLQASGNGHPIRQSGRPSSFRPGSQAAAFRPTSQGGDLSRGRMTRSASDPSVKFNWAKSPKDLQASLSLEERAWWWPCAPKGVASPVKVSQNISHVLTR